MYKLIKNQLTGETNIVQHLSDSSYIPMNPDNTDYQAYLKWLAEGNQPLPAENA